MTKLESAQDTINYVRQQTDTVIMFNSFGKDSLVTLDLIAPHFKRIICVFMYFVPNLDHINRFINQCVCRYPNVEVIQVPHFTLSYVYKYGVFCEKHPKQPQRGLRDIVAAVRKQLGLEYVFVGMKKADGMNRRLMLNTYAGNHYVNKGMCYPLAEWTNKEVLAYMTQHHLPEPVRYNPKRPGGGVGFDLDCHLWMEKNAPGDLEKFYQAFPWSKRILYEYHYNHS